jgi:hypothetical protein
MNRKRGDGRRVAELAKPGAEPLETRARVLGGEVHASRGDFGLDLNPAPVHSRELAALVRRQLELLGEDPERDGLLKTPDRVATSLAWLTRGYGQEARAVVGDAVFAEAHESMVMVRDIEVYSLCEHHLLPFFGDRKSVV